MAVMVDANQAGKKKGDPPPVWDYDRALTMAKELEAMGIYHDAEPALLDPLARRQLMQGLESSLERIV